MRRIIIASHERFAWGLKKTLEMLTNDGELYDISAYINNEESSLEEIIQHLFSTFTNKDKVIVLTDLLSGSVNQKFYPYIDSNTFLIAGVNLPLALAITLTPEEQITNSYIANLVEEAKNQIIFVNDYNFKNTIDEE